MGSYPHDQRRKLGDNTRKDSKSRTGWTARAGVSFCKRCPVDNGTRNGYIAPRWWSHTKRKESRRALHSSRVGSWKTWSMLASLVFVTGAALTPAYSPLGPVSKHSPARRCSLMTPLCRPYPPRGKGRLLFQRWLAVVCEAPHRAPYSLIHSLFTRLSSKNTSRSTTWGSKPTHIITRDVAFPLIQRSADPCLKCQQRVAHIASGTSRSVL